MNFKNFLIIGFLLVVLVALPVSFAADLDSTDLNSSDIDNNYTNSIEISNNSSFNSNFGSNSNNGSISYLESNSDTIYVNGSYTGEIENGSIDCPFKTINGGIDYFLNHEGFKNVFIANGNYETTSYMTISKDICIIGESPNGVYINCNDNALFSFMSIVGEISNLNIYNGSCTVVDDNACDIISMFFSNMTLNNVVLTNSSIKSSGDMIYTFQSELNLINCLIADNFLDCCNDTEGGIIYSIMSNVTIFGSIFDNITISSNAYSGGLLFSLFGEFNFINSSVSNSKILVNYTIGGIFYNDGEFNFINSSVSNSTIEGIEVSGGIFYCLTNSSFVNSSVSNSKVNVNRIEGGIFQIDDESNFMNCSISNSELYGKSVYGGVFYSDGEFSFVNSSVSVSDVNVSYVKGGIFNSKDEVSFVNSSVSNSVIDGIIIEGGIFYNYNGFNFTNSSVYGVNIDAFSVNGSIGYFAWSSILNKNYLINSSFENCNFTDICGLFYIIAPVVFENVTIANNYAQSIEGNLILYDIYNLSSIKNLTLYNNTFDNVNYNLNRIMNLLYVDDVFNLSQSDIDNLPTKYDLRYLGLVTSVKCQLAGDCWAFASIASLESYLLKFWNTSYDLSEKNLRNVMSKYSVNGSKYEDGGYGYFALAYFLRWSGPVLESDDPYDGKDFYPVYGLDDVCHIQGFSYIPLRLNFTDNTQIKYILMKYGAIFTDVNADSTFYYESSEPVSPDHTVVIVGWDDNYPASKLGVDVPGDGAFIIKNSWGTKYGEDGYHYVSYYDPSFAGLGLNEYYSGFVFTNVENTTNYDNIYQYDIFGNDNVAVGFSSNEGWCANQFIANNNEVLSSVGFYTCGSSNYTVYIYVNNTLVHSQDGFIRGAGYSTIKLNEYIPLNKGDTFKIAIKLITPSCLFPIAIEDSTYCFDASANSNESFVSPDGVNWIDLTDYYPDANVCIKAYTNTIDTVYVNGSYTGTIEKGTIDNPFKTINGGIDYFLTHEGFKNVFIANGNYETSNYIAISKDINIIGESPNGVYINCNDNALFNFMNVVGEISNLNIYNSSCTVEDESIYTTFFIMFSNITLKNIVLTNSSIKYSGEMIYTLQSELNLINCSITDNFLDCSEDTEGGIIYSLMSNVTVNGSIFDNITISSNDSYTGGLVFTIGGNFNFINSSVSNFNLSVEKEMDGFFFSSGEFNFINSSISNSTIGGFEVYGGIFNMYEGFNFINSNISNIFINATDVVNGIFYNRGDLKFDNSSVSNVFINASDVVGGIFYNECNLKFDNSSVSNVFINASDVSGGIVYSEDDLKFDNSSVSNVFINSSDVSGGIFYSYWNLKFDNSSVSNVFINASVIYGGFGYIDHNSNLNEIYFFNSYFSNSNFTDIYGLFYTRSAFKFENVTISYNYAETIEGGFIIYDVYNLSSVVDFEEYGNNFDNIGYNLSEIGNIVYMNDVFSSNITLPSSYDLRDLGLVTSVKSQIIGDCWALAAIGSLESYLLKFWNVSYDLSENNMRNIMSKYAINGSNYDPIEDGGNDILALAYLLRWSGAVLESDDPYTKSLEPIYGLDTVCHVQGAVYIPLRMNYTDNDQIKQAIMKYGAIYTTMAVFSDITGYYSTSQISDHIVVIVGWDDNYPGSNFGNDTPDGAFIVKNSWGAEKGDEGYYYISYYAPSFAGFSKNARFSGIAFTNVENTTNYDNIYQYDIFGNNRYAIGFSSNEGWCANKFTANNDEKLSSFGFYTYGDSNFTAYIYVNDELVYTQNGSIIGGGYNTIKLNKNIFVEKGDTFKIAINLSTVNYLYPIAIEEYVEDKYNATANPEESFVSRDGVNWIDLTDFYPNANVCIKAYTNTLTTPNVTIESFNGTALETIDLVAYVTDDKYNNCNGTLTFYVNNVIVDTVDVVNSTATCKYTPKSAGNFTVKAVYNGDDFHKSSTNTSNLVVSKNNITMTIKQVGNQYKSSYILISIGNNVTGAKITLKFSNGKIVTLTTSKGIAKYYIPFNVGTYKVNATLSSTAVKADNISTNIKITKASATIYTKALTTTYRSGKYLQIKVLNSQKQPIVNAYLQLKVYTGCKYKTVTIKTNNDGIAKYYGSALAIGKHKILITSKESTKNMVAKSKTTYITIKKAPVNIIAPIVKNKYKTKKYFKVKIKNKASGAVISGLTFKLSVYTGKKYKTYTLKTNTNGNAYLNTKYLSIGTHKVVIKVCNSYYYGYKSGNLIIITR